ncbi:MAG: hypothetical protein ACLQU3_23165 [Limisphaerales bacterium]
MRILSPKNAGLAAFGLALAFAQAVGAQDFTLTLQPSTATLIPGQNVSFVVSMTPVNGFTSQVTLAVETLPFGVTAQFSPPALTPPGTSVLQLGAATNAALGSFTLNISASGGGITNTTSSSVTVNFGLLPLCYGAYRGQVTDSQTGLPVPGALVDAYYDGGYAYADTNGMYIITNVTLGSPDNTPLPYSLSATAAGYWQSGSTSAYAVCDATNVVNLQMLRIETGSISGQVVVQGGGPLSGVLVYVSDITSVGSYVTNETNGSFQFPGVQLNYNNAPATVSLSASLSGYWSSSTNTTVQANSNSVVTLILVPVCTGTVTGKVIFANTDLPATNTTVEVVGYGTTYVVTDSNGNYTATNVSLNFDNAPLSPVVYASYPGYYEGYTNSALSLTCGASLGMPTLALQLVPPPPANNYGDIAGHVYDLQTGLPITNASLDMYSYNAGYSFYGATDTNGAYYITNILVGTGNTTNGYGYVTASAPAYFEASSNLTVYANEVVTQDMRLLLIGYGAVAGTVRDSATTLPIPGAHLYPYGWSTDTNGHYASGLLQLNSGNVPTPVSFYAAANGYWQTPSTNTTLTQGNTNIVDIDMIKVCSGATIVGNVVDALTQKPITNATVFTSGYNVNRSDMTDTNGNFILTNITVGNDNAPFATTVTATAPGYNQESKSVTIFCGATITTEFGAPETVFGGIDGNVTNVITGALLTNVFVGTGFGAATYTDTNGYYSFSQVPLGANGASIVWTVTASPSGYGFAQKTESVSVSSNTVSRLDFGFGQPPTALIVTATGAPDPVTVGSNLLYLVTLTNTVADAQQVQLSDALPPGVTFVSAAFTNSPGTPFSPPVYSNNIVTTTAGDFGSNSAVVLAISVTPTVPGTLTNVATVSSSTPDLDVIGSNHTATVITTVVGPAAATALIVTVQVAPAATVVGSNVLYTVTLTNTIANAANVQLVDTLPPSVDFVSDSVSNPPGGTFSEPVFSEGTVTTSAASFGSNSAVVLFITVAPTVAGTLTNVVTVTSTTTNLAPGTILSASVTNVASAPVTPTLTNLTVLPPGNVVFNPQTGLYQQSVACTNLSGGPVTAVRLTVLGLPSSVVVYNTAGSTNGAPYVEYDQTVTNGGGVDFLVEYYDYTRLFFASNNFVYSNFVVTAVAAVTPPLPTGTVLQLDRVAFISEGELTIEFATIPGHTYVVEYSADLTSWQAAVPPIIANATKTQWIDSGPPKTDSPPGPLGQRYYRVVQIN